MKPLNAKACNTEHGKIAEDIALNYLKQNKLKYIERNFRSSFGEIDLILKDKNTLVYIEVRYRNNNNFMGALETIDRRKCERIIATSQYYQQCNRNAVNMDTRFDVVVINGDLNNPNIEWIKNAFQA